MSHEQAKRTLDSAVFVDLLFCVSQNGEKHGADMLRLNWVLFMKEKLRDYHIKGQIIWCDKNPI